MEQSFRRFRNGILRYVAAGCSVASLVLLILKAGSTQGILILLAIAVTCSTFAELSNRKRS